MVLDGNQVHRCAHKDQSLFQYLFKVFHQIESSNKLIFFSIVKRKIPIFLYACAICSELPSNVSTRGKDKGYQQVYLFVVEVNCTDQEIAAFAHFLLSSSFQGDTFSIWVYQPILRGRGEWNPFPLCFLLKNTTLPKNPQPCITLSCGFPYEVPLNLLSDFLKTIWHPL